MILCIYNDFIYISATASMPLLLLRRCSAAAAVHELILCLVPERVQCHKSKRGGAAWRVSRAKAAARVQTNSRALANSTNPWEQTPQGGQVAEQRGKLVDLAL